MFVISLGSIGSRLLFDHFKFFSYHESSLQLTAHTMAALASLKAPIGIRPDYIATEPTTLRVLQHGKALKSGQYTISRETSNGELQTLFTVDGSALSWTQRRPFRNAEGLPMFDLYRAKAGVTFFIELPGGDQRPIVTFEKRFSWVKDKLDIHIANVVDGGQEVVLNLRGQDVWKLSTEVCYKGTPVVRTKVKDPLALYVPGKKVEWEVQVAAGMDVSLVSFDATPVCPLYRSAC